MDIIQLSFFKKQPVSNPFIPLIRCTHFLNGKTSFIDTASEFK
jgi:hypothetical protein